MTTSNLIKLLITLLFIFGGALILFQGHTVFGIVGIAIGIAVAYTTFRK